MSAVALLDFLLLVPLVIAALDHAEGTIDVLGPLHGAGFVVLIGLVVRGSVKGLWGWWFPVIAVITGGPPGCLAGDVYIRRQLARARLEEGASR
ncbi:MAG: hypothetical protein M3131_06320 [Actinomycetota bacterium]|nr:hypothetical protein [Actinomycetota bacterium]